jgi:hypothetical protein
MTIGAASNANRKSSVINTFGLTPPSCLAVSAGLHHHQCSFYHQSAHQYHFSSTFHHLYIATSANNRQALIQRKKSSQASCEEDEASRSCFS